MQTHNNVLARIKRISLIALAIGLAHLGISQAVSAATLDATLEFEYLYQSTDEGQYYNGYHFTVTNTGDVDIFAVFLYPQSPAYTGGAGNDGSSSDWDAWAGWSAAAYDPDDDHFWYMANAGDTYIEELDDVPNPNGWEYGNWLGVWWNSSHNPTTHLDGEDSLGPGMTVPDLYYTIWGVEEGDPSVPDLIVMLAGYDPVAGEVLTRTFSTSAVPIPSALWLLGSGLVGLVGIRKRLRK